LKIATWNVNSVRHRLSLVTRFLRDEQPDVLCLQETKVLNELFPAEAFRKLGYVHQAIHGQKAYHGVAVLAKNPFRETGVQDFCREGHARHMGVTLENGVELHNFYVPAGGDIPDPKLNDKFAHKLHFLREMEKFFAARDLHLPTLVVGDFNVAPEDRDVHDPAAWVGNVHVSPEERAALGRVTELGLVDSFRHFEQPEKSFSWWDYRQGAFRRNHGLRIDLILAHRALLPRLVSCRIDAQPRRSERASDHTPVVAVFGA